MVAPAHKLPTAHELPEIAGQVSGLIATLIRIAEDLEKNRIPEQTRSPSSAALPQESTDAPSHAETR